MKRLHPIMFAGTGSDVGKSIVAAAFCRIFRQDGYQPAPFKAQNMALNSFVTPDGLEIGRAQAVQAEAAGIPCHTDMNPLLLKPQSDHTSQVVLHGKPIGNKDAYDYWRKGNHNSHVSTLNSQFRKEVCDAYDRLAARYNPIVMEGAGSISEINLRNTDLVNLPMARHAKADVILVGDIDRGGVFASVYGSIALQTPEDRALIKGIIINKFRGDMRLFEEGRKMMEDICGIPVLGVIPYMKDIHIEEEDSVALAMKSSEDIRQSDIIILPGTKSTLSDLYELRRNGCAQAIIKAHHDGATVLGICGGYQMLGREVSDPLHVEGDIERLPGLGLLPITTTMEGEKVTRQTEFHYQGQLMKGYEIHMGQTTPLPPDGGLVWEQNHCLGTYVHGILDNQAFVEHLLAPFHDKLQEAAKPFDYQAYKEEQYNRLADHVRQHVDMDQIYQILTHD